MQTGTKAQKQAVAELSDPSSYVFLADAKHKVDDHDTGRFEMGKRGSGVEVELSPFGICKWTVSNAQFQLFDDNFIGVMWFKDLMLASTTLEERLLGFNGDDQPAIFVSWYDGYWYATFIGNGLTSLGRRFVHNGLSWRIVLPSEAQFEYAARAGGNGSYFRNEQGEEVTEDSLSEYAHFNRDGKTEVTANVKAKKPNAWGIHQSSGNVWKWAYDQWTDSPIGGFDPLFADDDTTSSDRVIRGGGWGFAAADCRSIHRYRWNPWWRLLSNGMILALSPLERPSRTSEDITNGSRTARAIR